MKTIAATRTYFRKDSKKIPLTIILKRLTEGPNDTTMMSSDSTRLPTTISWTMISGEYPNDLSINSYTFLFKDNLFHKFQSIQLIYYQFFSKILFLF